MVGYLSDDDLWFPEHLERMCDALQRHNVVNVLGMCVHADGTLGTWYGDLNHREYRERMRGTWNFIPLSTLAHRMDFYRKLPLGWHPAPPDTWTDLHMWRKLPLARGRRPAHPVRPDRPGVPDAGAGELDAAGAHARARGQGADAQDTGDGSTGGRLRAAFMSAALRDRAHSDAGKEAEVVALRASGERSAAERDVLAGEVQGSPGRCRG